MKLAISDKVIVPVKGSINDASGKAVAFDFSLVCTRMTQTQIKEVHEKERTFSEVMLEIASDWKGQRLVLDDDGKPMEYSSEAYALLLEGIPGMGFICWDSYKKVCGAQGKEKN